MASNPQARVLELIRRFNNDETICIEMLKNDYLWLDKSEKTIRRDLDVIKEYFPDSFTLIRGAKGEKGCYKAITSSLMDKILDKNNLALLIQTFNIAQRNSILSSLNIDTNDKKVLESKLKKTKDCYLFITKPFESKKDDTTLFDSIEKAITLRRYLRVRYNTKDKIKEYLVKPYKILFMNENFYLACENRSDEFLFTNFRVSNIESVKLETKSFQINQDIKNFIKSIQTSFATYNENFRDHLIKIVLKVDKKKAKFFISKKHLPSQTHKYDNDANLIVTYEVTQELEVHELIKKWIPYITVVSPKSLRDSIKEDIVKFLDIS